MVFWTYLKYVEMMSFLGIDWLGLQDLMTQICGW